MAVTNNSNWLSGLRESNHAVFQDIFYEYHHSVFLNIKKLVHSDSDAEDILQDVFYLLWQKRNELTNEQSVAGWLFTTSYYKSLEFLRKSIANRITTLTDDIQVSEENHVEEKYLEQIASLNNAISLLPGRKRAAFQLYRIEGKSYDEVAEILNISRQSVKDYVKTSSIFIKKHVLKNHTSAELLSISFIAFIGA